MKSHRIHLVVLGTAVALTPSVSFAQDRANPTGSPMQSQTTPNTSSSGQSAAQDSNATPGTTALEMKDKIFLRKAAEGGIAEVKMGQLAADKASSADVKSFGSKMVADHTMLSNELKPIADSLGVRLPKQMNKMDQAEYDKLSSLSGDDFDKEYIANMVKDHRKDLHEFHMEASTTQDASLKTAVDKGEGVIREHTQMIVKIARDKGIMVQPPSQASSMPPAATPPSQ